MNKKPPVIRDNTQSAEAEIQAAIASDPNTWEATSLNRKRGRPTGSNKTRVTLYLDNNILEKLKKPSSKGWQTRLNKTLQAVLD